MISNPSELREIATTVRREVLERSYRSGVGHLGGTFSVIEILVTLYFSGYVRASGPHDRASAHDYVLLSKGHACLALYSVLNRLKILPDEILDSFGKDGGIGAQLDTSIPGIHWNTGSLGHALGVGAGLALGGRLSQSDVRVFAVMGDAEFSEGSIWEAMQFASEYELSGLVAIVDRNRLSVTSSLDETGVFSAFQEKVESFGWNYVESDGHTFLDIQRSLEESIANRHPTMFVANTLKGKGVSFMEGNLDWHHGVPSEEEYVRALEELG